MNILRLISGVVGLFKNIAGYFADKQLINAGKSEAKNEQLEAQQKKIARGLAARRDRSRGVSEYNRD